MFSKTEAIGICNDWGVNKIPFLFIIDFEMKAIMLFRLDSQLPSHIKYSFHGEPSCEDVIQRKGRFVFRKHPLPFHSYETSFSKIQQQIRAGNSFLTNLTFPTPIETTLTLRQIFNASQAPYKLLVEGKFVCFSPESFITIQHGIISTRPMKGTINAALPMAEEIIMASRKETAEHYTVVDLLRNDISMVATDVKVKQFRYIDRIISNEGEILQVSSEITGNLPPGYRRNLGGILFALLPAGSVSGAPKIKTVSLIREVEQSDRGYYTGVCGIFDGENMDSAVMIRFIEVRNGNKYFRSGGGITFMSHAWEEYNELINKVYVPIT